MLRQQTDSPLLLQHQCKCKHSKKGTSGLSTLRKIALTVTLGGLLGNSLGGLFRKTLKAAVVQLASIDSMNKDAHQGMFYQQEKRGNQANTQQKTTKQRGKIKIQSCNYILGSNNNYH